MKPLISVIVPAFNREVVISNCIKSVLCQTYDHLELIVVDDGSDDKTADVIAGIDDSRIRYFYQENGGASSARNSGLRECRGEMLAFLDSDDEWPHDFLERMSGELLSNSHCNAAYCCFKDIFLDGTVSDGFGSDRYLEGNLVRQYYQKIPCVHPSASLFLRSLWEGHWWDERLKTFNDVDVFLRLSPKAEYVFVKDIYTLRHHTKDSLIYQPSRNLSFNPIRVFERFYFDLGGKDLVPARVAYKKISRFYRGQAREYSKVKCRKAALSIIKRAIRYFPFDLHYYRELLSYLMMSRHEDPESNWQMPQPLPRDISVVSRVLSGSGRKE